MDEFLLLLSKHDSHFVLPLLGWLVFRVERLFRLHTETQRRVKLLDDGLGLLDARCVAIERKVSRG